MPPNCFDTPRIARRGWSDRGETVTGKLRFYLAARAMVSISSVRQFLSDTPWRLFGRHEKTPVLGNIPGTTESLGAPSVSRPVEMCAESRRSAGQIPVVLPLHHYDRRETSAYEATMHAALLLALTTVTAATIACASPDRAPRSRQEAFRLPHRIFPSSPVSSKHARRRARKPSPWKLAKRTSISRHGVSLHGLGVQRHTAGADARSVRGRPRDDHRRQPRGEVSHGLDSHALRTDMMHFGPVAPGASLTIEKDVDTPGVFMYHCAVQVRHRRAHQERTLWGHDRVSAQRAAATGARAGGCPKRDLRRTG